MVEDNLRNLEPAYNMGMLTILVGRPGVTADYVDLTYPSVRELIDTTTPDEVA